MPRRTGGSIRGGLPVDAPDAVVSSHAPAGPSTSVRHPGRSDPHQTAHPFPGQAPFVRILGRLRHGMGAAALVMGPCTTATTAPAEVIGHPQNGHVRLLIGVALGIVLSRRRPRAQPVPVPLLEQPLLAEAGVLAHVVPVVAVDDQRVDVRGSRPAAAAPPGPDAAAHALEAPRRGSVGAAVLAVHDGVAEGDGLGRRMIIVVWYPLLLHLHLLHLMHLLLHLLHLLHLGCAAIALMRVLLLLLLLLHHSSPGDLRQRRLRLGRVDVLPGGVRAAIAAQIALAGVGAVGGGRRTRAAAAPITRSGGGRPTNTSSPGGACACAPIERQILVDGIVNGPRRRRRSRRTRRAHRSGVMATVAGGTCRWRHEARLIIIIITWRLRGGIRVLVLVLLQAPPLVSRMVQHGSAPSS